MSSPVFPDGTWQNHAACQGTNPDLFFPGPNRTQQTVAAAKAICVGCPVRLNCLEYALAEGENTGIWGGMDEKERRTVRRLARQSR